jgi:hypothetical protein
MKNGKFFFTRTIFCRGIFAEKAKATPIFAVVFALIFF